MIVRGFELRDFETTDCEPCGVEQFDLVSNRNEASGSERRDFEPGGELL